MSDQDWEWSGLGEMEAAIIRPDVDGDLVFCPASAAEYIRKNYIPRARVEELLKRTHDPDAWSMPQVATLARVLLKMILERSWRDPHDR